jgi:hypothetical protein
MVPIIQCLEKFASLIDPRVDVEFPLIRGIIDTPATDVYDPQTELIGFQIHQAPSRPPDRKHSTTFTKCNPYAANTQGIGLAHISRVQTPSLTPGVSIPTMWLFEEDPGTPRCCFEIAGSRTTHVDASPMPRYCSLLSNRTSRRC